MNHTVHKMVFAAGLFCLSTTVWSSLARAEAPRSGQVDMKVETSSAVPPAKSSSPVTDPVFWGVAGASLMAALLACLLRESQGKWVTALLFAAVLGTLATFWGKPIWPPVTVGLFASVVLAWFFLRGGATEREDDDTDMVSFLFGAVAAGAAVHPALVDGPFVSRVLPAILLALGALAIYVWRLRQPVAVWLGVLALGYIVWSLGRGVVVDGVMRQPLYVAGGGLFVFGVLGALARRGPLSAVLFGATMLLGVLVAGAGWAGGLLKQPVGWTVGVGLPAVYVGLGLALIQRFRDQSVAKEES